MNQMAYERQILLDGGPVPRRSVALLSLCAHLAALVLVVVLLRGGGPHIVPAKKEAVEAISGTVHLAFNPAAAKALPHVTPSLLSLRRRRARVPTSGNAKQGAALQALRAHAKAATAGMIESIKVREFYGFSAEHYDLPAQTAGKLPAIAAEELPPHFEQYVMVEVTIDTDGRVADVRVVGGEVAPAIQQRLLAAVREFKYTPARRDGTPIPSQLDIVVHIPS